MPTQAAYDDDFYTWTQEQARLLRDLPRATALPNALDLAHIAEEIEDLGKSEVRRVASNILQLMIHLIKLSAHGLQAQPSRYWVDEIIGFQINARAHFTPDMRQLLDGADLWQRAKRSAAQELQLYNELVPELPEACPFEIDAILDDDFDLKSLIALLEETTKSQ